MHVEDTLDPSHLATRKVTSMSEMVAEMVLGACDDDEAAEMADAAALEAARDVAVEGELAADSSSPAPPPTSAPVASFEPLTPLPFVAPLPPLPLYPPLPPLPPLEHVSPEPQPARGRRLLAVVLGAAVLIGGAVTVALCLS